MSTTKQHNAIRKEQWYAVQYVRHVYENNAKFDEEGTDYVLVATVDDVYKYYADCGVDVNFTILSIQPITHREMQRRRRAEHTPYFCITTGQSFRTLREAIKHTWEVLRYYGRLCKWRYYPFEG